MIVSHSSLPSEEGSAKLPSDFLWGVSYAGHQVDGGDESSDTTFLENVTPSVFGTKSGRATDSWNRWEEDLDLARQMGLNAFRFSTEWARIEPEQGQVETSALDHYGRFIDGCLERGLSPVATLSHFTAPHWFAKKGGWLNPDAAQLFADECERVITRIGDRLSLAVTLNEPNLYMLLAWMDLPDEVAQIQRLTLEAAQKAAGVECYRVGNVVLEEDYEAMQRGFASAHTAAREVVRSLAPSLPVGLSLSVTDDIGLGDHGEQLVAQKRHECYEVWKEVVAGDDFIGVQNYEQLLYGDDGIVHSRPEQTKNESGTAVRPESLARSVEYVHAMTGLPIVVTEHGVGTHDDTVREQFLVDSLDCLEDSRDAGTPIYGYFHWTLMDNFEWVSGFDTSMGLYSVDRDTMRRSPKPSAGTYAQLVAVARTR